MRRGLADRFDGLPDVHYGDAIHFVDEPTETGITNWTLTGTVKESNRLKVWGCDFFSFRDGLVIRKGSCWKIVE